MVKKTGFREIFNFRVTLVTVFFIVFLLVIIARLFMLQVISGAKYRNMAEDQRSFFQKIAPIRGEIKINDKFASQPVNVATNVKKTLVYANPSEIKNPQEEAQKLAVILNVDETEIAGKLEQQDRKYISIKKQISEDEEKKITEIKLPGIYFDYEQIRFYPEKKLLSQVVGFVGYKDDTKAGLYGLERMFEKGLAGVSGKLVSENDITGAWIFGSRRDITPAVDGSALILTVDKSIQLKAESVLQKAIENNQADSGSVIVINPSTGSILAMANFPDFDLNEYSKVKDHQFFSNSATLDAYEPGSIFKPFTMAAALEEGKVTPDTTYNDTGKVEIDGYVIKNSDEKSNGIQTMTQVLEKSLNTGIIFAKEQIGNKKFLEYVKKFGFGQETGIELAEVKGSLDNLKGDIGVNYDTAAFGQGISATPIQLVQAFSVLANNGKMMKPFIVQSENFPDGTAKTTAPEMVKQIISPRTANVISAMLVNVVENGHGKKAAVPGYYIAGKTGTAQVPKKNGKGYEENNNIGSFIGYGPVEDPKFLILVRINHPRTVKFAETTAAPAFGELAKFILSYYNIPPTRNIK